MRNGLSNAAIPGVSTPFGALMSDLEIIEVAGRQVVLCHYPMREWPY
jgi:calcineurin-like phosphoesterase family protein